MKALTLFAVLLAAPLAQAYSIGTPFTDPCHERITLDAAAAFASDPEFVPPQDVPIPRASEWREAGDAILKQAGFTADSDVARLVAVSMVIGVRFPDTQGHSSSNMETLRYIHANPNEQHDHFLRAPDDDGVDGNQPVIDAARARILESVRLAIDASDDPPRQQIITVVTYVDYYGEVEFQVWAPLFYAAAAAHTLQDGFSHTIRNDDLGRIHHVMNYIDAIGPDHDEGRDGLGHSVALDSCNGAASEIAPIATQVTTEYFTAYAEAIRVRNFSPVEFFFDSRYSLREGCELSNNYCDSKWADVARTELTAPIFNCQAAGPPLLPVALALWPRLRRRRRAKPSKHPHPLCRTHSSLQPRFDGRPRNRSQLRGQRRLSRRVPV